MKKLISFLMLFIFMFSFTSCSNENAKSNSKYSFEKPNFIKDTSNILFIGNSQLSYNDSPKEFSSIASENGKNVTVNNMYIDGSGLEQHCEAIRNNENDQQEMLKQADVVVLQDYWLNCQSEKYINEIKGYCKKDVKMYFYLTHYNSGVYADVWKYSSNDWIDYQKLTGQTVLNKSPYDAWKRYINNKATDDDIKLLSNNILYAPYDAYKNLNLYYIPEGFTFDRLIFNYNIRLEELIESTDYIHPTSLMSYIDALIIYRTLFGNIKADANMINTRWDNGYSKPKALIKNINSAVEESYNEFYLGTAKVLEFKSKYQYVDLNKLLG